VVTLRRQVLAQFDAVGAEWLASATSPARHSRFQPQDRPRKRIDCDAGAVAGNLLAKIHERWGWTSISARRKAKA